MYCDVKDSLETNLDDFYSDFRKFFYSPKLIKYIGKFERQRIIVSILMLLNVLCTPFIIGSALICLIAHFNGEVNILGCIIFCIIVTIIIHIILWSGFTYKTTGKILALLLKYISDFRYMKRVSAKAYVTTNGKTKVIGQPKDIKYLEKLKIYNFPVSTEIGYQLKGTYRDVEIDIYNLLLGLPRVTFFKFKNMSSNADGVVIRIQTQDETKNIDESGINEKQESSRMKSRYSTSITSNNKKNIKKKYLTGNKNFDDIFEVSLYKESYNESVFGSVFCEKLIAINKSNIFSDFRVSFEYGNLNFLCTGLNFSIPIFKSLKNSQIYEDTIWKILIVLSIVDAIKNQD